MPNSAIEELVEAALDGLPPKHSTRCERPPSCLCRDDVRWFPHEEGTPGTLSVFRASRFRGKPRIKLATTMWPKALTTRCPARVSATRRYPNQLAIYRLSPDWRIRS